MPRKRKESQVPAKKEMSDLTGRPYKLADGQPIERLFA